MFSTIIYYKGKPIDEKDITVSWADHWGERKTGSLTDYVCDRESDAVSEAEAGEG